ncbi:MAG: IPT/TIG domain-containing protein [Acidobacteriia bacterium]|nr:IPT/TIG domain-containing protein [Terriglobia bacterium]
MTKATSSEVDLSWSGSASSYTVQRGVLGSAFSTIATATTTSYKDSQIDPYATYEYEITANSANSNQVTVGPPPVGFQVAAPVPAQANPSSYGFDLSMVFDGNGDPAFAFLFDDPNQDTDHSDTQLLFRSWNRAKYAWNPVATVATVGDIATTSYPTVSLAYDSSNNTFAVAAENNSGDLINLYVSSDGGVTWTSKKKYQNADAGSYAPSLALSGGKLYLAYELDHTGIQYITGTLASDPSTWTTSTSPKLSGTDFPDPESSPSLVLDSAGKPAIAYFVPDQTKDHNSILLFWRPGSAPVRVTDSQNNSGDTTVKLRFFNTNPRIAFFVFRNDSSDSGVHFVRSEDGGATWKTPVLIPPDIGASGDYPIDLALNSRDAGAIAFEQNSSTGAYVCGFPKLALSSDLDTWKTCAPGGDAVFETTGNFSRIPAGLAINYAGNDKLYLMWQDDYSTPTGNGILLWREPPASQAGAPSLRSNNPVQDAVNNQPEIVAGAWVSIYGSNFSDITTDWSQSDFSSGLPTQLAGIQVTIAGKAAAVYYVTPTQINVQAPSDLAGSAFVQVFRNGVPSANVTVTVVDHNAGLFAYSQDYITFYPSARFNANPFVIVGDPAIFGSAVQKAKPGDSIQLYANALAASQAGVGSPINTFHDPVTVTVGSTSVKADFAGLVAPGLFQVNFTVPNLAPGNYPISITADGSKSQDHVVLVVGQ